MGDRSEANASTGQAPEQQELSRSIELMVREFGSTISIAARRYGLSTGELDDVVQDVRIRLWKLLERGGERSASINATYAYRAAASAAIDLVRRDRARRTGAVTELDEAYAAPSADMSAEVVRLAEALETLAPSRRIAVKLHLDGQSLTDIARALKWSEAQARNQVYRGLADLKEALTREER